MKNKKNKKQMFCPNANAVEFYDQNQNVTIIIL